MNQWNEIKDYLLNHPDCKEIHKMVWDGVAYLTEYDGTRHEITDKWELYNVMLLVGNIKTRLRTRNKIRV